MIIWCSDIHLNFLGKERREDFYSCLPGNQEIAASTSGAREGESILITGDIAESHNIESLLSEMKSCTKKNIYFVAGNHDYYGSSIKKMRSSFKKFKDAYWLPRGPIKIDNTTMLVGQDGWGDGRNGDYENSRLVMSDWLYIEELNKAYLKGSKALLKALQKVSDLDASNLAKNVLEALQDATVSRIVIATHVPPLEEAALYAGTKSTPSGLPFFSSQILGVTLLPIIEANPQVKFIWLSGHTHARCTILKRGNLKVRVAEANYYYPQVEDLI